VRENTERPITVSIGTNVLVGRDREKLRNELSRVLAGKAKKGIVPPLWDGHAGERIASILVNRPLPMKAANLKVI
jgi:UDP-N-acetylglucosamine 2-epimerase (non-hydrolysing)